MDDELDKDAIIEQYQRENEDLRYRMARKYFSLTPLVDEVKWRVYDGFRWVGEVDPQRMIVYIALYSAILSGILDIIKTMRQKPE